VSSAGDLGRTLSLASLLPFGALLFSAAVLPLVAGHWWERNRNKALVAALCAAPVVLSFLLVHGQEGAHELLDKGREYVAFLALLGALYVIAGGIELRGSLSGTPTMNTALLGLGALLANLIGTTGASVLLVRPLLRANAPRVRRAHIVVFFIFVVANCGGLLTPLGDPPLFLGHLKGVPFEWTLRLWPVWLMVNGTLLVVFHLVDTRILEREDLERPGAQLEEVQHHAPLRIAGAHNFLLLAGVVATIVLAGRGFANGGAPWPFGVQEGLMLALALGSLATTSRAIHAGNGFTFAPLVEVALLFAGIFVTMTPALLVLNAWGLGQRELFGLAFGLERPAHYFWATGGLSSFLDNAPTYLTLAATACGQQGVPLEGDYLAELVRRGPAAQELLAGISCGAVLMGANTYIGNGPNFMVKAIAEQAGVRMPGFFAYLLWSGLILLPLFAMVTLVFFA